MGERVERLRTLMAERNIGGLLITKDENQRYLEGFKGSECYLLVTQRSVSLIADSRYTESAGNECRSADIVPHSTPHPPYNEAISALCAGEGIVRLGFEEDCVSYSQYRVLAESLSSVKTELVPSGGLCEEIRAVKDERETEFIRRACSIADGALEKMLPSVKEGVSESELVAELEYLMTRGGADGPSFPTMVLFGAKSASPHAVPSHDAKLRTGDLILIDFGAKYEGYCSDTTRTFVFGKASSVQKARYDRVLTSQKAGVAAVRAGVRAAEVDAVSRGMLEGEGCFKYALGHGVGLEIHELPMLRGSSDTVLKSGMVLTVEPGLYIPGRGGIRIEDTVLVTDGGREILTRFPKESLIEL